MFKADKDYQYSNIDSAKVDQFTIQSGDYLEIKVFSNNGYQLVDVKSYIDFNFSALSIPYVVRKNGYVMLPLLDSVEVTGLTIPEAEKLLSQRYSYFFVNPYVKVSITNNHVVVFNGRGQALVVPFTDNDLTLIEAIGYANGVQKNAKAAKIKLIRGEGVNQKVYLIDLSTPQGTQIAKMDLAPDDVIYVEPGFDATDFFSQITPFVSLAATTTLIIFNLFLIRRN